MEGTENRVSLSRQEQLRILTRLTDAVIFEEFIQKRFIGAKSFSLEGAESLIPLLDLAIEKAGDQGIREIVLGMAHRGRLNVLANIMGKSPQEIFREFDDVDPEAAPRPRRREVSPGLQQRLDRPPRGATCTCRCASTPAIWSSSIRWPWAACGPSRTATATRARARHDAVDPRRRGVRRRGHRAGDAQPQPAGRLHAPAARCTSWSTTRSASPPRRPRAARAPTPPTWPRCCKSPSSTSTAKIPKPWPTSSAWRWIFAASSSATW